MKRVEPHQNFEETIQRVSSLVVFFKSVINVQLQLCLYVCALSSNMYSGLICALLLLLQLKTQKARKKAVLDKGIHDRNKDHAHAVGTTDIALNNYTKHP